MKFTLESYINYCTSYNGMEDIDFKIRDKAVNTLIRYFGFRIGKIDGTFMQLFKTTVERVYWVQFNSSENGGQFWCLVGTRKELKDYLETLRIVEDGYSHLTAKAGKFKFVWEKNYPIIEVWSTDHFSLQIDTIEVFNNDFVGSCQQWLDDTFERRAC